MSLKIAIYLVQFGLSIAYFFFVFIISSIQDIEISNQLPTEGALDKLNSSFSELLANLGLKVRILHV